MFGAIVVRQPLPVTSDAPTYDTVNVIIMQANKNVVAGTLVT